MGAAPLLTFLKNGEVIRSCQLLPESPLVVGRGQECVVRLKDRAISRKHAVFTQTAEGVQVEKKSDYAPLTINGKSCDSAVLVEGDVIALGPYLIKISIPKEAQPEAPVRSAAEVEPRQNPVVPLKLVEESASKVEEVSEPEKRNPVLPGLSDAAAESMLPQEGVEASQDNEKPALVPNTVGVSENRVEPIALEMPEPASVVITRLLEIAESDAATKVAPIGKVGARLIFKPGTANFEEYRFDGEEISIGRGKACTIVLNDKRASRKNAIIRKAGLSYVIKDLNSANGTFVN